MAHCPRLNPGSPLARVRPDVGGALIPTGIGGVVSFDADQSGGRHHGTNFIALPVCRLFPAGTKLASPVAPDPSVLGVGAFALDLDAHKISADPRNILGTALLTIQCGAAPHPPHPTPHPQGSERLCRGLFFVIGGPRIAREDPLWEAIGDRHHGAAGSSLMSVRRPRFDHRAPLRPTTLL
jgi:hypothetical protein